MSVYLLWSGDFTLISVTVGKGRARYTRHVLDAACCMGARHGPWGQSRSQWWKGRRWGWSGGCVVFPWKKDTELRSHKSGHSDNEILMAQFHMAYAQLIDGYYDSDKVNISNRFKMNMRKHKRIQNININMMRRGSKTMWDCRWKWCLPCWACVTRKPEGCIAVVSQRCCSHFCTFPEHNTWCLHILE